MGIWRSARTRSHLPVKLVDLLTMSYHIPTATVRTEIVIQRSRFVATAGYADTPEAARALIDAVREEMPDANHHVYAFRVGYAASVTEGMSDDGEPSGTSGPPILAIIRGTEIGDLVIVVTRYFGGTKLGTGGLVRAYSEAARTVLAELPTEVKIEKTRVLLEIPYSHFELVKRLIGEVDGEVLTEDFTTTALVELVLPTANLDELRVSIRDATANQVVFMPL